jgi:hypothetical protein
MKNAREVRISFEKEDMAMIQCPRTLLLFGIQQKFQRDRKSSLFVKLTANMFVKIQHCWKGHDLFKEDHKMVVPITFLNQVIVSPYGMPRYKTLLHKPPEYAILNLNDECFAPFHGIDGTGKRVSAYVQHIVLAGELQAQNRYLSRPASDFKFLNKRTSDAIKDSWLTEVLKLNQQNSGLYQKVAKFQRERVKKWKGSQAPTKLLCMPLSVDDETKTEECGSIVGTIGYHPG